jgi:hypothetical protein
MYEVCRVQKLDTQELAPFDEQFIDHLLEMVETTRNQQDESLNYAVIKLILALNEQFMVATLPTKAPKEIIVESPASTTMLPGIQLPLAVREVKEANKAMSLDTHSRHTRAHTGDSTGRNGHDQSEDSKKANKVLMVLMRRLGSSKTFGENIVFMLNRAGESLIFLADVQKTQQRICVCNFSFSKCYTSSLLPLGPMNTSTPMTSEFCSMSLSANW